MDPGSEVTGGAVIRDSGETVGLYECHHRTNIKGKRVVFDPGRGKPRPSRP